MDTRLSLKNTNVHKTYFVCILEVKLPRNTQSRKIVTEELGTSHSSHLERLRDIVKQVL